MHANIFCYIAENTASQYTVLNNCYTQANLWLHIRCNTDLRLFRVRDVILDGLAPDKRGLQVTQEGIYAWDHIINSMHTACTLCILLQNNCFDLYAKHLSQVYSMQNH